MNISRQENMLCYILVICRHDGFMEEERCIYAPVQYTIINSNNSSSFVFHAENWFKNGVCKMPILSQHQYVEWLLANTSIMLCSQSQDNPACHNENWSFVCWLCIMKSMIQYFQLKKIPKQNNCIKTIIAALYHTYSRCCSARITGTDKNGDNALRNGCFGFLNNLSWR